MSLIKKYRLRVWVAFFSSAMLLGCGTQKPVEKQADQVVQTEKEREPGGQTLAKLRKRGSLKVGLSSFRPWAIQDARGEWIGFEVEIAQKLAEDLGLQLELVPTAWAGIIPALLIGKFDIINGMSVTEERTQQVSFSQAYEYSKTVLLLGKGVEASSIEEMNSSEYRLVGRAGSSPFVLTYKLLPKAQLKSFDDDGLSIQDLVNGQADGFLTTSIEAAAYVELYPNTIFIPEWGREVEKEELAFALEKDVESAWLELINEWVQDNWDNGFLAEKSRYWFESRDWTKDYQLAE